MPRAWTYSYTGRNPRYITAKRRAVSGDEDYHWKRLIRGTIEYDTALRACEASRDKAEDDDETDMIYQAVKHI